MMHTRFTITFGALLWAVCVEGALPSEPSPRLGAEPVVYPDSPVVGGRDFAASAELAIHAVNWTTNNVAGAGVQCRTNTRTLQFEAVWGADGWRLKGDFAINGQRTVMFDGTNLYTEIPAPEDSTVAKKPGIVSSSDSGATEDLTIHVTPNARGYPGSDPGVNIAWMAFCSSSFFAKPATEMALPTLTWVSTPGLRSSYELLEGSGLPKRLVLFSVGEPGSPNAGQQQAKFEYVVTATTNYNDAFLPLEFEFRDLFPTESFGKRRLVYGTGRLRAVGTVSERGSAFDTNSAQTVVDWRFASRNKEVNAIIYRTKGANVEPTNSPALQQTFALQERRAPYKLEIRKKRIRIVCAAMVLLISVTLLYAFIKDRRESARKRKANTEYI